MAPSAIASRHGAECVRAGCLPVSVFVIFREPGAGSTMAGGKVTTGRRDAMHTGLTPSRIDTTGPSPARMCNAVLGGTNNRVADWQTVHEFRRGAPEAPDRAYK